MPRILSIVGARPQFVKAAAVSGVLRAAPGFTELLVHTGQHYDDNLSEVFFRELEIPKAEINLGIGSGSHGEQTGRMLEALERVIGAQAADWVLVYGDTNSTLAAALAAAKLGVRIAHVEAGLRSFNRSMPEEINRVVVDNVADLLFAPTAAAVANLEREGLGGPRIVRTGDVMCDALLRFASLAEERSRVLEKLGLEPRRYLLATVHRAENTDSPARLRAIFEGLAAASRRLPVLLPLHPRTRKMLRDAKFDAPPGLRLIEPVGYLDMLQLERHARLVVTDSGGVQKEAYLSRVPCVTLRAETEWVELIDAGWNTLLPPHTAQAVELGLAAALERTVPDWQPLYGDGRAAEAIVAALGAGRAI